MFRITVKQSIGCELTVGRIEGHWSIVGEVDDHDCWE